MIALIARRVCGFVFAMFAAAAAIFVLLNLLPGDPAAVMLGLNAPPETVAALRQELGLDQSLWVRFVTWLAGLLHGDMGMGLTYRVPIAGLIFERMKVTLPLSLLALFFTLLPGLCLGIYTALRARKGDDVIIRFISQLMLSVPNFWMGLLLILIFAIQLHWFPAGGFAGWNAGFWMGMKSLILPSLALAITQAAILLQIMRASLLDVLSEPYMRTARAKGLRQLTSLYRHALRNAFAPVITLLGLQLTFLLTGVVVIENVFALPGIGRLIFQAVSQHDLPVVQNLILVFVAIILCVHFILDLLSIWIDPRLRRPRTAQ
ncbi:MAG: ABC transporter permease [Pseudomonadota bacterium]